MTARHPTRRSIDYELIKRATEHDPEKWALEHNGALPNGTMNKSGYALDCTYPQSVSKALSGATARTADGVVNATAKQVQDLEWYMALCTNVYCPNVIVNDVWDCPYCNQTDDLAIIKTFNTKKEDTNVLVARGDKEKGIFIAFRGSGSTKNWIANLDFILVDYPPADGTKVHKGFFDSYNDVASDLTPLVKELAGNYSDYAIHVTGHSLGAATALLCAMDLYQQGLKPSLYTFGGPRVGDPAFAEYVVGTKILYERTVNKRDIVAHLPPAAFGYRHAGQEFWITEDESVVICPNGVESDSCSNSIVPFTSISDHTDYFGLDASC
ncbi:hypothetical protein LRAMOSA02161 [Lichtheimia ramosa]|uniref:Fungal lipase-type domain-containing protein n=1 Tax=Lichtheimia ramosa TaxID=688394 RepID=A0A077WM42_9FUNG|nr:hypothetical protein LRAMOSA02161 [Lichtheimia ramosa]